ncbi:acetyltransferase [Piscibacillus sp. B03]|uniref:acetyltransferase n=1 Tax=Piscibacillus sp. B03 TaxID=3457430 RepID=UPI003FCE8C8C
MNLEEFEIKIAQEKDSDEVIKMLKEVAQWLKDNGIDQWGFLLEGGDDQEIAQAISNEETYIIMNDVGLIGTFTLLPNQGGWDKHIYLGRRLI